MQVPLQVTLRDIDHSPAVEEQIKTRAEKLNQYSDQIISCHVVVEYSQKNQTHGKLHNVRIYVSLPHRIELAVSHKQAENLYLAIHEAFDCMTRQIEEAMGKLKGEVKNHPLVLKGKIARIFGERDFGFIETMDGTEYYFNAGHVSFPHFNRLKVGCDVHFIEKIGSDGPQAHRVRMMREDNGRISA